MRISVEQLTALLQTSVGAASSRDQILFYLGIGLEELFRHDWPWTLREEQQFVLPTVTETQTFTWVAGDDYITAAGAMVNVNWTHTGRYVRLGSTWYRVMDVSHRSSLRIYLNKRLLESQTDPTLLTFYRADMVVRSNQVVSVSTDQQPLTRWAKESIRRNSWAGGLPDQLAAGSPDYWSDDQNHFLVKPAYPPTSPGTVAGALPAGIYHYFYTRYDYETGYESEPGPTLVLNHPGGSLPQIRYGNTLDRAEDNQGSWGLRLYRSDVNPRSSYVPMMLIQSREPGVPVTTFADDRVSPLYSYVEYWRGKQSVITLWPIPDGSRQITVNRHEAWGWVPRDMHVLDLGEGQVLMGLLTQYIASRMSMAKRDPAGEQAAMALFNRQLNYELTRTRDPGGPAMDVDTTPAYYPGKGLGMETSEKLYSALGRLQLPDDY